MNVISGKTCCSCTEKWFTGLMSVQEPPERPLSVTMGIKAALPKYEIYFYNTVLCLAMFWAASWIFEVSSCEYEKAHAHKVLKYHACEVLVSVC